MATGQHPQAAVVHRRVFQREPERHHRLRRGDEEAGVLVPTHLAADVGLFEDHLALPHLGLQQAQFTAQFSQGGAVRERIEDRIAVVQRVPDLVDAAVLRHQEAAFGVQGFFFEKAMHGFGAGEECGGGDVAAFAGGKTAGVCAGREGVDDLAGAPAGRGHLFGRLEARQHQTTVALPGVEVVAAQHVLHSGIDMRGPDCANSWFSPGCGGWRGIIRCYLHRFPSSRSCPCPLPAFPVPFTTRLLPPF